MKRTTITLSSSNHNRTPEQILSALATFMPVIGKVESCMLQHMEDSDRLVWNVLALGCSNMSGRADVQWMSYKSNLFPSLESIIYGGGETKSGFVVKASSGAYIQPDGELVVAMEKQLPEDAESIANTLCENMLRCIK